MPMESGECTVLGSCAAWGSRGRAEDPGRREKLTAGNPEHPAEGPGRGWRMGSARNCHPLTAQASLPAQMSGNIRMFAHGSVIGIVGACFPFHQFLCVRTKPRYSVDRMARHISTGKGGTSFTTWFDPCHGNTARLSWAAAAYSRERDALYTFPLPMIRKPPGKDNRTLAARRFGSRSAVQLARKQGA